MRSQGTLPFRALALRYGADTVFTEEVIDRRVLNAVRTENSFLGSVDYVEARGKKGNAVPFQTCALERDRVVYQIGTSEAANALRAAQVGSKCTACKRVKTCFRIVDVDKCPRNICMMQLLDKGIGIVLNHFSVA